VARDSARAGIPIGPVDETPANQPIEFPQRIYGSNGSALKITCRVATEWYDLPSMAADRLRDEAEGVLRLLAGAKAKLRYDQWLAIEALVAHRKRVLCVQRTGWGKSAVYFVATALLRTRGAGPTLIISPLLALMRNQVEAATRAGIVAQTTNSSNLADWNDVYSDVLDGRIDTLLVSPERLNRCMKCSTSLAQGVSNESKQRRSYGFPV
jgi:ATP-dependent DNA helicase RecQ